ncbi:helix-turn-helix domain-containing protein [Vagococcus luciliae]|uniref:Helix-turn-helix domain-containing protein n=1 Tax=Vagococcus luciliae TaxID=2920380 RepID=A0ABY5NXN1_9ENTE|nr:helix-turn-helix domain-containing protein [Vagococcus luciliae]UUV98400.1 hypothetical protein G314FT_05160 [Vagococcus luciliae]
MNLKIDQIELTKEFSKKFVSDAVIELKPFIQEEIKKTNLPEYMSLGECCQYIGVSRNTLKKFIDMGLKVFSVDGIQKISKQEVRKFIENHSI